MWKIIDIRELKLTLKSIRIMARINFYRFARAVMRPDTVEDKLFGQEW